MADAVAVNGPDTPGRLLVRFHADCPRLDLPAAVGPLMWRTWLELGSPAGLCLVAAPAMNRAPAGYGNVWVADGLLAWYADPGTGQRPGGLSPDDLRTPVYGAFAQRGVFVDAATCRTLDDLARAVAHELRHAAGLGRTVETHAETEGPGWQKKLAAGLAACAAAARKWRAD